jgi:asparagine synthase (glutamine-hydrolysing)
MARMYDNIELNLIRTDSQFYLQGIDRYFAATETIIYNASNRVWFEAILQESRQQGVRVLLSGSSGNLTISWVGKGLLPQLLRRGRWPRALHEARALALQHNGRSTLRTLIGQGVLPLLPTPLWLVVERMRSRGKSCDPPWKAFSAILPEFARAQRVDERAREKGHDWRYRPISESRFTRNKLIHMSQDLISDAESGYRAQFGVDLRDPTGDERIVGFCLSLPEEQYLRDGMSRRLIRRAMAVRLPTEVLENRMRGLQAADWFERLRAACPEILNELADLEQCQLARNALDLERMRRLVEQISATGGDMDRLFMDYRMILEKGLALGRFLRWFESGG